MLRRGAVRRGGDGHLAPVYEIESLRREQDSRLRLPLRRQPPASQRAETLAVPGKRHRGQKRGVQAAVQGLAEEALRVTPYEIQLPGRLRSHPPRVDGIEQWRQVRAVVVPQPQDVQISVYIVAYRTLFLHTV